METLFENCTIDLDNGIVKTQKGNYHAKNVNGYHQCRLSDCYGNMYHYIHEVIIAEGLQLPKHMWPKDEKGKRFQADHIIPVSQGGTDAFSNLRLVSEKENHNNQMTRAANSESKKGLHTSQSTEFKKGSVPWNKGKKYHTGVKRYHSDEAKAIIAEKMKGQTNAAKKVYQYTMEGVLVKIWNSASEAGAKGFNQYNISACCNGKRKQSNGYKWSHKPM